MTAQEQLTLDIVVKISSGELGRKEGQKILNVSERTLRRYLKGYSKKGPLFVKHGNYKKTPANRAPDSLKAKVQTLIKESYYDFNLTHALEKLRADHEIMLNRETLRQWSHEIQMVKRAKRRSPKVRRRRERMAQTGIMLQMDGSPHHWFGGKPSCLIAAIDDADSDVPYAEFFPAEDTISCMRVIHKIIEKMGIFQILYVDRAGIFGGQKRSNFSQVKRALGELGIHVIFANSPEAKGRIERLWNTFQDRLVPELRIRGIKNYDEANAFLQDQFLPQEYASRFKVVPFNLQTAYKPLPDGVDLKEIFCLKEHRTCKRDHTFSWNGEIYRIDSDLKHSIHKQQIEIRTYQDLQWQVFFAGKPIAVSLVKEPKKAPQAHTQKIDQIHPLKVRLDGHVTYRGRHYSVAEKYVGEKISIAERENQILIYHQGVLIETHVRVTDPHKLSSTKAEHLSSWEKALDENSPYRKAARYYGAETDAFVKAIIQRGNGIVDNDTIWGVLGLDKTYDVQAINDACKFALDIDTPTYKVVKSFLKLHGSRYERERMQVVKAR